MAPITRKLRSNDRKPVDNDMKTNVKRKAKTKADIDVPPPKRMTTTVVEVPADDCDDRKPDTTRLMKTSKVTRNTRSTDKVVMAEDKPLITNGVSKKVLPKRGRGRPPKANKVVMNRSVATSTCTKPFTSSQATVSLSSVGQRRRRQTPIVETTQSFTKREKKVFYECLSEKGFSCLEDEELLQQLFPNRTIIEIKSFIDSYRRKSMDSSRRPDEVTQASNAQKQPIEKWFDIIHQSVPNITKKDDISAILVDIVNDLVKSNAQEDDEEEGETDPDLIPDFQSVYSCIRDTLDGKYAPQLRPIDAFVCVKLIEELKELMQGVDHNKEIDYATSGQWWRTGKSGEGMFTDIFMRRQQQNEAERDVANGEVVSHRASTSSQSKGAGDSAVTDANERKIQSLQNYPKLRKIIECFNPIKVPVDLMADQLLRWKHN